MSHVRSCDVIDLSSTCGVPEKVATRCNYVVYVRSATGNWTHHIIYIRRRYGVLTCAYSAQRSFSFAIAMLLARAVASPCGDSIQQGYTLCRVSVVVQLFDNPVICETTRTTRTRHSALSYLLHARNVHIYNTDAVS